MARISKRTVDAMTPGSNGEAYLFDDQLGGFAVRLFPSGTKTYYLAYRLPGSRKLRRLKLGQHGAVTPDEARRLAKAALGRIAAGEDPASERVSLRTSLTVARACNRFLEEHSARRKAASSQRNDRVIATAHVIPALGDLPLRRLEKRHVAKLHSDLHETPVMANRVRAFLSKLVSWAQEVGEFPEDRPNPVLRVKPYPEHKRIAQLDAKQLAALGRALDSAEADEVKRPAALIVRALLLTGCRLSEIQSLRWSAVDLSAGVLRLTASKTGPRDVVLGETALKFFGTLGGRPDVGDDWVFRSPWKKGVPVGEVRHVWYSIRANARLSDLRLHDLRHVFASNAVSAGLSLYQTGRLLGHRQAATTQRYAHLGDGATRAAANLVARNIARGLAGEEESS